MTLKECCHLLQIREGASLEEVKSAYRKRAFQLHPDLNPDKHDAARQFQRLNEAYVLLVHNLEQAHAGGKAARAKEEAANNAKRDYHEAGQRFDQADGAKDRKGESAGRRHRAAASYQAGQDEVLQDILRDPFARRVFEDIYREIRKGGSAKAPETAAADPAPPSRKLSFEFGKRTFSLDLTNGMTGMFKKWARRMIDSEQIMYLPAANLVPGSRMRLQIRRGLSDEASTVEFTLPSDFVVGRPVRLKGLGKRLGPWKGDLYIKLFAKL